MSKRQSFVVIVPQSELESRAFGPYRSFKRADGDARAVDGFVLPIESVDDVESAADTRRRSETQHEA